MKKLSIVLLLVVCCLVSFGWRNGSQGTTYYVLTSGNDSNNGTSPSTAWLTISKVNAKINFQPGDRVLFGAGQSFTGCLLISDVTNPSGGPFIISSFGTGNFTLNANCSGDRSGGIEIRHLSNVLLENCTVVGGNSSAQNGILLHTTSGSKRINGVTVQNCDVSGFGTTVLDVLTGGEINSLASGGSINNVRIVNNTLHGAAGVTSPDDCGICGKAGANGLHFHTYQGNLIYNIGGLAGRGGGAVGNGIVTSQSFDVVAQFNVVHDIGANTDSCGGPAAIWTADSDTFIIQFNEAYNIQPVPYISGCDWNAWDLDLFVRNSYMQYNYAHDNVGACLVFWETSTKWFNNTARFNMCENNGNKAVLDYGCIYLAGSAAASGNYIYNNTCINTNGELGNNGKMLVVGRADLYTNCLFANNIFYATVPTSYMITTGSHVSSSTCLTLNNDYFSTGSVIFQWGNVNYTSLAAWQAASGPVDSLGRNSNPLISSPGNGGTCNSIVASAGPQPCPSADQLQHGSPMIGTGLNITVAPYSLNIGTRDYYGNAIPNGVGTGYNIGADGAAHP